MQRLDIARHDQRDPPFDTLGPQPDVDQVLALAADHDRDVARVQKYVRPLQPRADGVAPPHRERVTVGVKPLPVKSGKGVADRDHHVDGAGEFGGEDRRPPPRHHVDPDVRRLLRDLLHQRRHQQFDRQIRHHQAKLALASRRVELVGDEQGAHLVERLRQRRAQRLRPRRQLHTRPGPHQQRVADQVAQPPQRVACGRLR